MKDVVNNYFKIKDKIESLISKRNAFAVAPMLLPVSKGQSVEKIIELISGGVFDFGENYVQEIIDKTNELHARGVVSVHFHFIGHLQSNKVKKALPYIYELQSVDSLRLAEAIDRELSVLQLATPVASAAATSTQQRMKAWLQVNIDLETSKYGFLPSDFKANQGQIIKKLFSLTAIHWQGFMCIPKADQDAKDSFERMRKLVLELRQQFPELNIPMKFSMGMSHDYETAIQVGTDCVRIGTAIFGARV
jgi:PLP dependent protein